MRVVVVGVVAMIGLVSFTAQAGKGKIPERYRIEVNLDQYPQQAPQDALKSILKAIENKQVDYLLAHLADPEFVDKKVAQLGGAAKDEAKVSLAFGRLVKATTEHFQEDPTRIKELYRFAKEGEWQTGDKGASARHKTVPTRRVFLKKIQERWFLEDRDK